MTNPEIPVDAGVINAKGEMVKISILYIGLFVSSLFSAAQVHGVTRMTHYGLFR